MLNLEKSILQMERGFFVRLCVCMSQTSIKRMLSSSFGDKLITLDYDAQF